MENKEKKIPFIYKKSFRLIGILAVLALALILLWYGNATSNQAQPALVAQVYFDGEYRIADGPWQKIVHGEHIPATVGDVTLRGNFHMLAPDGEYIGLCSVDTPIAFYMDHVNVSIRQGEGEPFVMDMENPLYGDSSCGASWIAYILPDAGNGPMEILIHNPHSFGNETAVDQLLENVSFWSSIDFEKEVLNRGASQRTIGFFFVGVSFVLLGTALFSTLIHLKITNIIWLLGGVILFAGAYLAYSAEGVVFWSESIVSNTVILGCSMMFYMLFLSMSVVHLLKVSKGVGMVTVALLVALDGLCLLLPMVTELLFYDLWVIWIIVQTLANTVLLGCLLQEAFNAKGKSRWMYFGLLLPLLSFEADVVMTDLGLWKGGASSAFVFVGFFVVAMVAVLRIIPSSINAVSKAKALETEKIRLNAQLTESRVSTMMSQIRPHFIYNTLGSIEQLCSLDPPKAGELVHNFSKYLRGNFGELDNPKPILMSREMEHVRHYIHIENVRFPDMTFSFEMNSRDFRIPALSVQPIVENAIKHGLMKLPKGGKIRVVSYETDTHYCVLVEDDGVGFDTGVLLDERKHVGIRNIRGRLQAMVNGTLEIESTVGVGTKVWIRIPKEVEQ